MAAAERGKKVIVGENQVMSVADHDFTKFSLVPSVHMFVSSGLVFLIIYFCGDICTSKYLTRHFVICTVPVLYNRFVIFGAG